MRMLMSFDTSTTSRSGCFCCSVRTTARIWLSVRPEASVAGSSPLIASVCRKSLPLGLLPVPDLERKPLVDRLDIPAHDLVEEAARLGRALRETSDSPRLCWSSSSRVAIGR